MMKRKHLFIAFGVLAAVAIVVVFQEFHKSYMCKETMKSDSLDETNRNDTALTVKTSGFREISHPTPNYDPDKRNRVEGVILHHTAEPTVKRSLEVLTTGERHVGTHVVIDTDGTRYIMCEPEVVTYHAGKSILNGEEGCNDFTIGIEFQGNTLEQPLTEEQINSGIEYLLPLIAKYDIPVENIVTHEMVRMEYKKRYPNKRCSGKVDITPKEYKRFMAQLNEVLNRN